MPTTYEILATTTLSTLVNTFTISGIPNTYTDLRLVCNLTLTAQGTMNFRCNGVSTNDYVWQDGYFNNSTIIGAGPLSDAQQQLTYQAGWAIQNTTNLVTVDFLSYTSSVNKPYLFDRGIHPSSTSANYNQKEFGCGFFTGSGAISSITVFTSQQFYDGGTATLFGILKA